MKTRKILALLLALVMMLGLVACGAKEEAPAAKEETAATDEKAPAEEAAPTAEKYVIGVDCPMTGNNAGFGEQMSCGAQMAVDQINEAGGINGVMLELDVQDDKSDPKEAVTITTNFCADENVVAIFGYYNSSCQLAALPIVNEAGKLTIGTGSNPDITTQNGEYAFRIEPSDAQQATRAAEWMVEDGRKEVAILFENTDFGYGQESIVRGVIEAAGGKIVASEAYIINETRDFTNVLTKIKSANADSLFIAGTYTEGGLIAKQQKALGMSLPTYSSATMFEVQYLESAGEAGNGTKCLGVLDPNDPDPEIQAFQKEYKERFGEDKTAGTFSAHGYFAVKMIAEAIEKTGSTDSKTLAEYLEGTEFTSIYGNVHFDENHDLMHENMTRLVVEDGAFKVVDSYSMS